MQHQCLRWVAVLSSTQLTGLWNQMALLKWQLTTYGMMGKLFNLSVNHLPSENEAKSVELSIGLNDMMYTKHSQLNTCTK